MSNLLNLLDPDYTKNKQEKQFINDLKNNHNIYDNPLYDNKTDLFKYTYNNDLMHIIYIDYDLHFKRFVPIPSNYVIELEKKQCAGYFLFKFTDGLYIWKYDRSSTLIEYQYNENSKNIEYIYTYNNKLEELK